MGFRGYSANGVVRYTSSDGDIALTEYDCILTR